MSSAADQSQMKLGYVRRHLAETLAHLILPAEGTLHSMGADAADVVGWQELTRDGGMEGCKFSLIIVMHAVDRPNVFRRARSPFALSCSGVASCAENGRNASLHRLLKQ